MLRPSVSATVAQPAVELSGLKTYPRWFEGALVLASTVPFLIIIGIMILGPGSNSSETLWGMLGFFVFLNGIHVPATLYLFSDKHIRSQVISSPVKLIAVPISFLVLMTAAYTALALSADPASNHIQLLLVVAFLYWQLWHFGMQSYGVLSFVSITSGRPSREPGAMKFEKRTVMAGAVCGMLAQYHNLQGASPYKNLQGVDYALMDLVGDTLYRLGQIGCYALSLCALVYVFRNRSRFTPSAAAIYLISVCFFLPDYLTLIIPNITPANSIVSLLNFSIVHGTQYLIFLLAHTIGCSRTAYVAEKRKGFGLEMIIAVMIPPMVFLVIAVLLASFISSTSLFPHMIAALGMAVLGHGPAGHSVVTAVAVGFSMALAMAHFWLDQYFWKLSKPAQRQWLFSRFQWVLPARNG